MQDIREQLSTEVGDAPAPTFQVVDAIVLLYAVNPATSDHRVAHTWLDNALSGGAPVGFAWLALIAFATLATHPAIFDRPLSNEQAVKTGGNLTDDAHLAALALDHKATVVSFDSDFSRFPGIRWERPS